MSQLQTPCSLIKIEHLFALKLTYLFLFKPPKMTFLGGFLFKSDSMADF